MTLNFIELRILRARHVNNLGAGCQLIISLAMPPCNFVSSRSCMRYNGIHFHSDSGQAHRISIPRYRVGEDMNVVVQVSSQSPHSKKRPFQTKFVGACELKLCGNASSQQPASWMVGWHAIRTRWGNFAGELLIAARRSNPRLPPQERDKRLPRHVDTAAVGETTHAAPTLSPCDCSSRGTSCCTRCLNGLHYLEGEQEGLAVGPCHASLPETLIPDSLASLPARHVTVTVIGARDLIDLQLQGRQNPYCVVRLLPWCRVAFETSPAHLGHRNPQWGIGQAGVNSHTFNRGSLSEPARPQSLLIEMRNREGASSRLLGWTLLELPDDLSPAPGADAIRWLPLVLGGEPAGFVCLSLLSQAGPAADSLLMAAEARQARPSTMHWFTQYGLARLAISFEPKYCSACDKSLTGWTINSPSVRCANCDLHIHDACRVLADSMPCTSRRSSPPFDQNDGAVRPLEDPAWLGVMDFLVHGVEWHGEDCSVKLQYEGEQIDLCTMQGSVMHSHFAVPTRVKYRVRDPLALVHVVVLSRGTGDVIGQAQLNANDLVAWESNLQLKRLSVWDLFRSLRRARPMYAIPLFHPTSGQAIGHLYSTASYTHDPWAPLGHESISYGNAAQGVASPARLAVEYRRFTRQLVKLMAARDFLRDIFAFRFPILSAAVVAVGLCGLRLFDPLRCAMLVLPLTLLSAVMSGFVRSSDWRIMDECTSSLAEEDRERWRVNLKVSDLSVNGSMRSSQGPAIASFYYNSESIAGPHCIGSCRVPAWPHATKPGFRGVLWSGCVGKDDVAFDVQLRKPGKADDGLRTAWPESISLHLLSVEADGHAGRRFLGQATVRLVDLLAKKDSRGCAAGWYPLTQDDPLPGLEVRPKVLLELQFDRVDQVKIDSTETMTSLSRLAAWLRSVNDISEAVEATLRWRSVVASQLVLWNLTGVLAICLLLPIRLTATLLFLLPFLVSLENMGFGLSGWLLYYVSTALATTSSTTTHIAPPIVFGKGRHTLLDWHVPAGVLWSGYAKVGMDGSSARRYLLLDADNNICCLQARPQNEDDLLRSPPLNSWAMGNSVTFGIGTERNRNAIELSLGAGLVSLTLDNEAAFDSLLRHLYRTRARPDLSLADSRSSPREDVASESPSTCCGCGVELSLDSCTETMSGLLVDCSTCHMLNLIPPPQVVRTAHVSPDVDLDRLGIVCRRKECGVRLQPATPEGPSTNGSELLWTRCPLCRQTFTYTVTTTTPSFVTSRMASISRLLPLATEAEPLAISGLMRRRLRRAIV